MPVGDFLLTSVNCRSYLRREIQLFLMSVRNSVILGFALGHFQVFPGSGVSGLCVPWHWKGHNLLSGKVARM